MTIASSGPLRITTLIQEYNPAGVGNRAPRRLGDFRRGNASLLVRANSANNGAVNASAGVPTSGPLRINVFRGQGVGWTYTNTTARICPSAQTNNTHYYCHNEFGDDWLGANGTNWPCYYINNAVIASTSTSYIALVIYGRQNNGPFTFTNNNEIQGAGGQTSSAGGQHACYIQNSDQASYPNRPIIINNYAFRGGGGAGGQGGTGGTGGQGYYNYTATDPSSGDYYNGSYMISYTDGGAHGICSVYWNGLIYQQYIPPAAPITIAPYIYYTGHLGATAGDQAWYGVYRQWTAQQVTNGGGGGAGGAGGRGIGYNSANQGGAGGAPGAGGGTNAGSGGYGGTGGTGGSWGAYGATGNTGATGNGGNYSGGSGGAAGGGGGPPGYSIYGTTQWGCANNNTLNGPYSGGSAVGPT